MKGGGKVVGAWKNWRLAAVISVAMLRLDQSLGVIHTADTKRPYLIICFLVTVTTLVNYNNVCT